MPVTEREAVITVVEVFPKYRGGSIKSRAMEMVLGRIRLDCVTRVYVDMEASNKAGIRIFGKTRMKRLCSFKPSLLLGKDSFRCGKNGCDRRR